MTMHRDFESDRSADQHGRTRVLSLSGSVGGEAGAEAVNNFLKNIFAQELYSRVAPFA